MSRRARDRIRRQYGSRHLLRVPRLQARARGGSHHRLDGGAWAGPGRRGVHDAQRVAVSRRSGPGRARDVRGGTAANLRQRALRFTRAQFDALRRETNVFTDAYAEVSQVDSRVDGRLMFGTFVTGNFFQVLGVSAAMGRALTPADDEPAAGQPVMVLSHRGWDRLFLRDPAILGRRLLVNGFTFEIVGVMPEGFRGLTVVPDDYWAPLSMLGHVRPIPRGPEACEVASVGLDIIGRLKPGMSPQTARAGLAVWDASQSNGSPIERGASNITLVPRRGTVPQPLETVIVFAPLFFAFGLILLIGCANVANLLLARGRGATARDWHPALTWRHAPPHRPPAVDREPAACARGRRGRLRDFTRGAQSDRRRGHDQHGARSGRYPIVGTRRGLARAAVSHHRRRCLDHCFRARPRAARHAHRTDEDNPGRSDQGRTAGTGAKCPDWPAGQRVGAAAHLRGGVLEKCVCRGHVQSWSADLRHRRRPES